MASPTIRLIAKYTPAVFVAFVTSVVSFILLLTLSLRCDISSFGILAAFVAFPILLVIVGFVGVFFGTTCLPASERRIGSQHLLLLGLGFSLLPLAPLVFSPIAWIWLVFLALGGFIAVLIFRKLDRETSGTIRGKRLAIVLSVVIVLIISIVILLVRAGGPMTKEKAAKLFARAGGLDKVEQEANVLFSRHATNEYSHLPRSDLTNFPALSALGTSVYLDGQSIILIRKAPPAYSQCIYIFRYGLDANQAAASNESKFFTSKYIQVATNIFIMR